jgi:hypothetical protein
MVAPVAVLLPWRAAELGAEDHDRVVEHGAAGG